MTWASAVFVVLGFLALMRLMRVPSRVGAVVRRGRLALSQVRSEGLSDEEKERAMRAHAGHMFISSAVLLGLTIIAVALPCGVVALLHVANIVSLEEVVERTLSWELLLGAVVLGFVVFAVPQNAR